MESKPAVITGASTGIGRALAEVFARNGHDLLLVARPEDKLFQAADELAGRYGVQCRYVAVHLTDPTAPATVFAAATADGRAIGVLANNAGVKWGPSPMYPRTSTPG
jgi:short-subunit dehydrogenase